MLTLKVLGSGCANCHKVEEVAREAVAALNLPAQVEHVTERAEIAKYRLLATPGLVINEKVVCAGRIPAADEVKKWLAAAR